MKEKGRLKGKETAYQLIGLKVFPILHTANPHRHGSPKKASEQQPSKAANPPRPDQPSVERGLKERAGAERGRNGQQINWSEGLLYLTYCKSP